MISCKVRDIIADIAVSRCCEHPSSSWSDRKATNSVVDRASELGRDGCMGFCRRIMHGSLPVTATSIAVRRPEAFALVITSDNAMNGRAATR